MWQIRVTKPKSHESGVIDVIKTSSISSVAIESMMEKGGKPFRCAIGTVSWK